MKKALALLLAFITFLSVVPLKANASSSEDMTSKVAYGLCPACEKMTLAYKGEKTTVTYESPRCANSGVPHDSLQDLEPNHMHRYTETFDLYECTSCHYQRRSYSKRLEYCGYYDKEVIFSCGFSL